ncbi:M23 family metallopeptidase [Siculibacillus lacustris]|uniref:M23 family metallopeptidase n=1 Tax=Siculibacillus lacustris TaxID=1549641 RepID=A0A4Q9VIZ2_9HYPH|nr:M23 family metallopeptidase [Siculibacillus lacustris]TBW35243.1 M23 family metallopeptidase [Siculibacillus lacustris]
MTSPEDLPRGFGRRREPHRITIVHGDRVRAFHVDPGRVAAVAGVLGVFALAYLAATGYLVFRDDILSGTISRQIQQARAYEDRVAALRAEIDRINGRQLLDQESFEAKIDRLLERQTKLVETQSRLGSLVDRATEAGLKPVPVAPGAALAPLPVAPAAIAPPNEATGSVPAPLDLDAFALPLRSSRLEGSTDRRRDDPSRRIAAVERALDGFEGGQSRALGRLADLAETKTRKITRILGQIGFRVAEGAPNRAAGASGGQGGPFVPDPAADPAARADAALVRLGLIRRATAALPLARPLPGDPAVTSGFGSRVDPFLGVPALHTGIDFRADAGEPVRVTGPGTVISAGRQGGYGLCVDVDHGNGVVTRYGHLSRVGATAGQKIRQGEVIGFAGSTGRSTATHLHYETRVGGEAVDPTHWIEAGRELGL